MNSPQPAPMPEQTNNSKHAFKATVIIVIITLAYAIVRYNIARHVPWSHLPLAIANKSIALSATILIGWSFLLGPLAHFWPNTFVRQLGVRKYFGINGFALAALHAVIALVLLNAVYYPRLFLPDGQMNVTGEITMLFGIMAFLIFTAVSIASLPPVEQSMRPGQWKRVQRFGYLAYVLVLLHVALMGWSGWWRASSWEFGLVSISLLSSVFIIFVLIMRALTMNAPRKDVGG